MAYPYCSNKNCQLPTPEILNELHKELKWKKIAEVCKVSERTIYRHAKASKRKLKRGRKRKIFGKVRELLFSFTSYRSKNNASTKKSEDIIKKEHNLNHE